MDSEKQQQVAANGRGVQARLRALTSDGRLLAKVVVVLAALMLLALELLAHDALGYVPKHGKPCRTGYAAKHRVVKRHGHRRRVRVCVKRRSGATPGPTHRVLLHAHLDPTFTRDPLDPFRVTYQFSASATSEAVASASASSVEEPAALPSGVLALYSDGSLECAINVGGAVSEGKCPITYKALGQHRVTTIYTSGEQSATATELEQIEPLPTMTSLTAAFAPSPPHEVGEGPPWSGVYSLGTLEAQTSGTLDGGPSPGPVLVRWEGEWEVSVGGGPYGAMPSQLSLHATTHPAPGYASSEASAIVPFAPTLPGRWVMDTEGTSFTQPQFVSAFSAEYNKQTGEGTPLHVRADRSGRGLSPCVTQLRVDGSPVDPGDEGRVVGNPSDQVVDFPGLPAGPVDVELWVSTDADTGNGPCEVWGVLYASE
jgi:hypothetical protein